MSSDRVNRYKAQQAKIQLLREHREEITQYRIPTTPAVDSTVVSVAPENDVLDQFRRSQQQELAYFNEPIHIDVNEVDALLSEIGNKWGEQQTNELIGNCRRSVISSIANPFGLGTFVAAWDKEGGNVTTTHNFKKGIVATEDDQRKYEDWKNRGKMKWEDRRKPYDQASKPIRNANKKPDAPGLTDGYTGKSLEKNKHAHFEHITSVNEIEKYAGRNLRMTLEERIALANSKENTTYTKDVINTKGAGGNILAKDHKDLMTYYYSLTKEQRKELGLNQSLVEEKYLHSKEYIHNKDRESWIRKDGKELLITGAQEAGKMGLQQSIGLLLTEFFSASFDEISDSYRNGFYQSSENKNFLAEVKIRLSRIVERVSARWKDAFTAFKDGVISGFLSNLVTMLINMLKTTSKRIFRLIREGFLSILKAMKIVLFPPAGMTNSEAGDAALKLLVTGVTVSLGVLIEEVAEKSVKAFLVAHMQPLEQLTSTITAVLVGVFTGIATSLVIATLDKLDLFGVTRQRKHEAILSELDRRIEESDRNIESMYQNEMRRTDVMLSKLQGA